MAATLKVPTIFTAVDKMSSVVKTMSKNIKGFGRKAAASMDRFNQKLNKSFNKMGQFSKLAVGLGAGLLFREVIQGNIRFNDSLASVSAITGAVGDDLIKLEQLAKNTAKVHKKAGADVLKAYELVGSAKPELLGNLEALDAVTNSVILLSKASRLDLETSSLSLTDVMNQFNVAATESGKVIDILAAGAKFGAAAIPLITQAIVKFGTGAKSFNVTMGESVALVEIFAAKGIKGAEAGTKIRNILLKMSAAKGLPKEAVVQLEKYGVNLDIVSDKSIPLNKRLLELSKISGDSVALLKVFGLENKEAGEIILKNIPAFKEMTEKMKETGIASIQAAINTNTLKFGIDSIRTAFINATTATNGNSKAMDMVKKALFFVGDNMETVVAVAGVLLGAFIALKVVSGIIKAISVAQSIWSGITVAATAIQTAFAFAVNAGLWPVLLVIAAIAAIILIIKNWGAISDWFSKKWKQFTGFISNAWAGIIDWFKSFNFVDFFKSIGQAILSFMLMPMKGVLALISKIPGKIGRMASSALDKIGELTGDINVTGEEDTPALDSPELSANKSLTEKIQKNNIAIDIRDKGNNVENIQNDGPLLIPIKLTQTQGRS